MLVLGWEREGMGDECWFKDGVLSRRVCVVRGAGGAG